ncbi:lipoate--protein ligase family protein [Trichlorobacter lovleyi]|uniref:Biotin/lipoate A/B protein ligase n=1 Tax=Trichlorobacter lovleyi (strain ATCC BAA-1151 / DSM 17278 / SZ) TaxID=398767 RepID=B3E6X1_TRIL1|nr:lipoate--protein ligase family protein [Trichlorobacter lovleyi]ACD96376.1 biotin/lipoate A/B protein ligase [Trichlorobacter lovleyi SZ]
MHRQNEHGTLWRLIDTGPCCGRENMAIDEALFRCFDPAVSRPVLRLYGWQPPALSLGRFQKAGDDLDLARCRADNLTIVRRITGGGAIWHADELTYSLVCAPSQIPPAASVKDSFRVLTAFLLGFYRALGLQADYAVDLAPAGSRLGQRTPLCFAGKESYDIMLQGRKIGGNAQRRSREVIFQHGSIPLQNRVGQGVQYLKIRPQGLEQATTCLGDEGIAVGDEQLKQILVQQFAAQLGAVLQPAGLTGQEQAVSAQLLTGKYQADCWNLEGEEP